MNLAWTESQQKNFSFFQSQLEAYLADPLKKGKFALLHEEALYGTYDTFETALIAATSNLPKEEFVIQQVISENEIVSFLYAGR